MSALGPIGRLGRWSATHVRIVVVAWAVVVIGLGVLAPRVETALSGAGWEDSGSQSVQARALIQRNFAGNASSGLMVVVHSPTLTTADAAFASTIARSEAILRSDARVASVTPPRAGQTISADGHTAIVMAGAAVDPMRMVQAADHLKGPLASAAADRVSVSLTGASGMWSDFNTANRDAMMRSELISWPVTLAILVLAFGALVAAGLPLLLTILGLASSAGALFVVSQFFEVSIWAMNFALMFALALGIDYALFIVVRFRGSLFGSKRTAVNAVAETMDTAGKAVLFSGVTVLVSLSAVMLVPSPAFRSMALGIMIAVAFILAATLTLLPAVLGKLGPRVNRFALPWAHSGEHRSARFAAWGERLWARPVLYGLPALIALLVLAIPVLGLTTGMPSIKVVPSSDSSRQGYDQVAAAFGPGAPGTLQLVGPAASMSRAGAIASADPGVARVTPPSAAARGSRWFRSSPPAARPRRPPGGPSTGSGPTCRPGCSWAAPPPRTTTWPPCSRPTRPS